MQFLNTVLAIIPFSLLFINHTEALNDHDAMIEEYINTFKSESLYDLNTHIEVLSRSKVNIYDFIQAAKKANCKQSSKEFVETTKKLIDEVGEDKLKKISKILHPKVFLKLLKTSVKIYEKSYADLYKNHLNLSRMHLLLLAKPFENEKFYEEYPKLSDPQSQKLLDSIYSQLKKTHATIKSTLSKREMDAYYDAFDCFNDITARDEYFESETFLAVLKKQKSLEKRSFILKLFVVVLIILLAIIITALIARSK